MSLSPDELADRYDDPYRKDDRIEIPDERFERGIERGDDGAWGVGALVVDGQRALFVREGDTWLLPGGRLEPNESPAAGAKREVREETGIEIAIEGLGAIAEQTFVRAGTDETYAFCFATFLGSPTGPDRATDARPNDTTIEEVSWRREVPVNTFDRDLVTRLVEAYV
jgi:ADP-ribose pyrophosphatase YjhB (NUDIX family)